MKYRALFVLAATLLLLIGASHATTFPLTYPLHGFDATEAALPAAPERHAVQQAITGLSVPFEENLGQLDPQVAYLARTFAGAVFVTRDGRLIYSLPGNVLEAEQNTSTAPQQRKVERGPGWALQERLLNAQPLRPQGSAQAVTEITRFSPEGVHHGSTWKSVDLGQAWPGIEVEVAARGNNIEKLFHLAPGSDPDRIGISLEGAEDLRVGEQGELIVATGNGDIAYTAPVAWQDIDGERMPVGVRYALRGGQDGAHHYGFALDGWDRNHPLTIDPLIQSTYLGGNEGDVIQALAIAANGDVVVGGYARSTNLPGTLGGAQPSHGGGFRDGFVARLSSDLKTLIQSTYLGGNGLDQIRALAIAANGDVVVGGYADSTNLPGTSGGAQSSRGGSDDGFVARLSGDLKTLIQSTYLGGSDSDFIDALAIAANGDVVVGGRTVSTNLPGTSGGAQPSFGGTEDNGFVARLSGDLKTLVQSTYLGGNGIHYIQALAIAANGDVVVGGYANSINLPGTSGGAQSSYGGGSYDGFIARLSGDLKTLIQSTYLGGNGYDTIRALAIAANGDVVVGGITNSINLPGASGGGQSSYGGGPYDGLIARLSGDLTTLIQSTYLGGNNEDNTLALAIAANGDVVVGGYAYSTNLPGTSGGAQSSSGGFGFSDGFVVRLSGDLKTLIQSTYLGGNDRDGINALAIAANGDVVVGGYAESTNLPGTSGGAQPSHGGGFEDGFVARLSGDLKAVSPQTISFPAQSPASRPFVPGGTFPINLPATASSGLPVNYSSSTPAVCVVIGTTVNMLTAGNCTIVASQAGNANWLPAPDASQSVVLSSASSTVATVPTLSEWMLLLLSGLLVAMGLLARRRVI